MKIFVAGVRDHIYVVALALGRLSAIRYVLEYTGIEAVNLSTGRGVGRLFQSI